MARYLVVRDKDGAIVGELDSAESALRMFGLLDSEEVPVRGVSVVRIDESPGEIVGTSSITSMRPANFSPPVRRTRGRVDSSRGQG
jgi:hypothetical protein